MSIGSGSNNSAESSQPRTNAAAQDRKKQVEKTLLLQKADVVKETDPSDSEGSEDSEGDDSFDKGIYLGDSDTDEEDSDDDEYEDDSVVELVFEDDSKSSVNEELRKTIQMIRDRNSQRVDRDKRQVAMQMIKYCQSERGSEEPETAKKQTQHYHSERASEEPEVARKMIEHPSPIHANDEKPAAARKQIEYAVSERSSDGSNGRPVYIYETHKEDAEYPSEKGDDDSDSEKECFGYPSENDGDDNNSG